MISLLTDSRSLNAASLTRSYSSTGRRRVVGFTSSMHQLIGRYIPAADR